jgi:integrase
LRTGQSKISTSVKLKKIIDKNPAICYNQGADKFRGRAFKEDANMPQELKKTKCKAGRRGNNEGSIYQLKDESWCGAVTVGYKADGKPIRKYKYGKTRQEVAKKVAALTDEVFANGYITEAVTKERNFEILCGEWFELFIAGTTSSTTEASRRVLLKNHVYPAFGMLDIQDVSLLRLQKFFKEKAKKGLSSDYIGKMKSLLNRFFTYAVKQDLVKTNPVSNVVLSKPINHYADSDEKKGKALREDIRENVFAWVMENPLLKPIVITFTFTGLRPQELIALKWENVNLDKKTLFVKNALKRVIKFDDDGNIKSRGVTIGKTKTPKSVRAFTLPDEVVAVLNEWILYCNKNNINSDFVFPNTETGGMRSYSGLRSMLERFLKKHSLQGEKITLYTFRHTFATILLEKRENPKIVAELMGHARIGTTLDLYSHILSSTVYEQTAQTLDAVFAQLTQKKNPASFLQPTGSSD